MEVGHHVDIHLLQLSEHLPRADGLLEGMYLHVLGRLDEELGAEGGGEHMKRIRWPCFRTAIDGRDGHCHITQGGESYYKDIHRAYWSCPVIMK
jgi:hypothetical protein